MATRREQLELLVKNIQTLNETCKQAGRITSADKQKMDEMWMESRALKSQLDVDAMAYVPGGGNTFHGVSLNALGEPPPDGFQFQPSTSSGPSHVKSGPWAAEMKGYLERIGTKTITPSGSITVPSLSRGIVQATDRPRNVLSLIPFKKLEGTNSFTYLKETVRTHAASTVEAGQVKPTSVYSVVKVEDRVRTIASLSEPMDKATLDDVDLLQAYLEGALKEGVMLELEDQVINGAGSTTGVLDDMTGILASSPTAQVFGTDKLTTARKALTTLELQNLDPSGFAWAMAPSEWESLELLTSATEYVMGDPGRGGSTLPVDTARRSLWGVPVVTSVAIPTGFALLGDFKGSALIFEREGVKVDWSDAPVSAGTTAFEKNQLVFRAEGRWGLAVLRPAGFVYADLVA